MTLPDPRQAAAALAEASPLLIGVRHHSAACAAAIPALLDACSPDRVLVELPAELQGWVAWLGHPETRAPVALGAATAAGLAFYPFADFSPELAAVRWAVARGVPVEAFDLPLTHRPADPGGEGEHGVVRQMLDDAGVDDLGALWDVMVETPGIGAPAEEVRRAALAYGWAMRVDAGAGARAVDLAREAWMRDRIAAARRDGCVRPACVIGAFHAAALPDDPAWDPAPRVPVPPRQMAADPVTSMMPYGFPQLDERSGYPAGVRDPAWHQRVWAGVGAGRSAEALAADVVVEVCRGIRADRHVAGTPDAREALRVAVDLARLRGLPGPGRRELLEAITTALGQGEPLGRGRVLARVLERVMVGQGRGQLAPGTPRSGLAPHVEELIAALRLPGPGVVTDRKPLVLDPLRSDLDRRRHVTLHRLGVAGVHYAELADGAAAGGIETLTARWQAEWTAATDATLAVAGARGVTLEQAAEGALRARVRAAREAEAWDLPALLDVLSAAAACGLPGVVDELLAEVEAMAGAAALPALLRAGSVVGQLRAGHVAGLVGWTPPDAPTEAGLLTAALHAAEGIGGSHDPADAMALVELARRLVAAGTGEGRLAWLLAQATADGSPLMQGAALAVNLVCERGDAGGVTAPPGDATHGGPDADGAAGAADRSPTDPSTPPDPAALARRVGAWVDGGDPAALSGRLQGLLLGAAAVIEGDPSLQDGLAARIETTPDEDFLARVPALRDGFSVLSPAARERMLVALLTRHDADAHAVDWRVDLDGAALAWCAEADGEVHRALAAAGLAVPSVVAAPARSVGAAAPPVGGALVQAPADGGVVRRIGPADRWRLILGRQKDQLGQAARPYARALDELYGRGRGEGSRDDLGGGGGDEAPYPTAREWGDDLGELFGQSVRQEVLATAAEAGRMDAVLALDPEAVTPSVHLLESVLSLKGAMSEAQLATMRRLVERVVQALVEELAVRVRPALTGLTLPRPTRRRAGPLDLRRTVAANLHTARPSPDGWRLTPERMIFRTRGRRSMDWHVMLVVDTSGSMEPSIIHAAMMAAILSALPAVTVHFVAFSTEVVDLTDRADDPLALLMEVQIGGGTHIAKALRYARAQVTVPARTLLVLVSDFEEGGPVGPLLAEVRALVESGVTPLGLAALDMEARPRFCAPIAERLVAAGMPVAALTPVELARWVGEQVRR